MKPRGTRKAVCHQCAWHKFVEDPTDARMRGLEWNNVCVHGANRRQHRDYVTGESFDEPGICRARNLTGDCEYFAPRTDQVPELTPDSEGSA